jgi:multidrug efflux pump subunit AcrA (membrane-fusion protein)
MGIAPPPHDQDSIDATWREIDEVVAWIAQLAKEEEAPQKFYAATLERLVSALAAHGGAIWTRGANGDIQQQCLLNPPDPWICEDQSHLPRHADLVRRVFESGQPRLISPQWKPSASDPIANPTCALLVLVPWRVDQNPVGLIELFQRASGGPQAEQGCLRLLEVVAEILADFHRNCQLRQFKQIARDWVSFDHYARQVHAGLDLQRTVYVIVNEGRRLLECDRVSLLVQHGKRDLVAISGAEEANRRAELTRRMERLGWAVAKFGDALWFPSSGNDRPPELESLLSEYLDESHARALAVVPLMPQPAQSGSAVAVIMVEKFFGTFSQREPAIIDQVSAHATEALRNCLEHADIPFLPILRRARRLVKTRPTWKIGLAAIMIAGLAAAAFLLKVDFNVVADGILEPARLRQVFARADGTVSNLHVEHGQHVKAGDLLAVLRRPQLDLEFKQVLGELQTARQKLIALEAERLQVARGNEEQRRRYGQATAQEEELRETMHSLEAQYEVLKSKEAESEVRSPIEGEVLTWNVRQLVEDRPVGRGQVLMTIGDLSGPWRLELRIPEQQAGYVVAAQQTQPDEPLGVSCVLATNAGRSLQGRLVRLGMRSESTDSDFPFMEASVDVERPAVDQYTAGVGARARIRCGRRCVAYVWLHGLVNKMRMWLFF